MPDFLMEYVCCGFPRCMFFVLIVTYCVKGTLPFWLRLRRVYSLVPIVGQDVEGRPFPGVLYSKPSTSTRRCRRGIKIGGAVLGKQRGVMRFPGQTNGADAA